MASPDAPQSTDASHPFNRRPSTDIILRSCDLVDFYTNTFILAEASPFFSDMLRLPQPQVDPSTTNIVDATRALPIIDMSEDAKTLDLLLRLLYPILKPRMEEPKLLAAVLKAATKYDMVWPAAVVSEKLLAITPDKALQVWAAVCQVRTGLEDVARQAAMALRASWTRTESEALSLVDALGDMSGISAGDYLRLKQFLKADQADIDAGRLSLLSSPPGKARPPHISQSPFSTNLPSTDVICRSSPQRGPGSEKSFQAHRLILSMHSPVLRVRLESLQPCHLSPSAADMNGDPLSTVPRPGAAVLEFDEDADVLSALLRACYDCDAGLPTDLQTLAALLDASEEYRMERVARWTARAWDKVAVFRPLEAYFVALEHGLEDRAEAAAKRAVASLVAGASDIAVMDTAPAIAYHRLMVYHDACRKVIRDQLERTIRDVPDNVKARCRSCDSHCNISTNVKTSFTTITDTVPPHSREGLRDAFCGIFPVVPVANPKKPLATYTATLVRSVVTAPDEVEQALSHMRQPYSTLVENTV